jgi:four helix bundle protein
VNSAELKQRTKVFAHRCVKLASALPRSELGRMIAAQLMRSATSVASNYRAVCLAQSKAAFVAKLSVVLEEADEAAFWMEFIIEEKLLSAQRVVPLHDEAEALTRIFAASRKTSKGSEDRESKR